MTATAVTHPSVAHYTRAVRRVGDLVAAVRRDTWDAPTPCTDWRIRDLVNHLVVENLWVPPLLRGATIKEVGDAFDGDVLGDNPVQAWRKAAADAATAIADAGPLDRTVHLSFGDTPAAEYVTQLFADHLIHGWDLAQAMDADAALPDDQVEVCASWFDEMEKGYRQAGAVAEAVAVPPGADAATRLLARFGRSVTGWTVDRFGLAVNRHDVDAIMALMTPDCVFETTQPSPDGRRHEGTAAVRAAWEALFTTTPTARFDAEDVAVAADRAVVRWRYDFGDGHVRGVDLLKVRDRKVAEKLAYVKG